VQVESRPSPEHGQKRFVKAQAKYFQLTAQIGLADSSEALADVGVKLNDFLPASHFIQMLMIT